MSDINFCNTKEQLNHLGEVVTGKVDGSPTGDDIDTSTLPYTGQVRKTLPALEEEYQADIDNFVQVSDQLINDKTAEFDTSIANKEAEADSAIDAYRLLSKGPYAAGILLEDKFQYITYSGESYFAVNPPYTTTATTPDTDVNLFAGGYLTSQQLQLYTDIVYKASGGNSAVDNMIAGIPLTIDVGDKASTGFGRWKKIANNGNDSDFIPLNGLWLEDFIKESDPDDTKAWASANNHAELLGYGTVNLPPREVVVSIAESTHPYVCVLIPENTKVKGDQQKTVITRPASERDVDGILIANKGYDSFGGYDASGNITFDGFTITDGALTPNRSNGDLIALCHGSNIKAYRVTGGNHDQHLFDIAACDGVYIDKTCEGNNEVARSASSTIQIEGAATGGILGAFVDNTDTKNITVHGRKYRNTGSSRTIDLFHSGGMNYENINIDIDEVDAAYNPNDSCIGATSNVHNISVDGLSIKCKKIKTNNNRSGHLTLAISPTSGNSINNVDIDVKIEGNASAPVYIGGDSAAGRWGRVDLKVNGSSKFVDYGTNLSWSGLRLVSIDDLNLSDETNVSFSKDDMTNAIDVQALEIRSCGGSTGDGRYELDITGGGASNASRVMFLQRTDPVKRMNINLSGMQLSCVNGVSYHIYGSGGMTLTDDKVKISESKFLGTPTIANSFEQIPMLDGTNGWRIVPLGEANGTRFFSSSQTFSFDTGLKKRYLATTQAGTGFKFSMQIGYGTDNLGSDDVRTSMMHYISATQAAGIQIRDIDVVNGTFTMTTGNAGVGMSIDSTTFQPVIEANARVKLYVGI